MTLPDFPRTALIISPFATWPLDAGHRRRTYQVTRILKDAGFRITFLLFAFEGNWAWRHDDAACQKLQAQWDELLIVYAGRQVGLPPKDGRTHHLDEWWDADLEAAVRNLSRGRTFDVAVVHNVWLTKVFDFLPPRTVRVLETHDIFWKRPEEFRRIGQAQEFFVCEKTAEVFGIERAHIAVAIQEKEGVELLRNTNAEVVTVPFYDPALEQEAHALARSEYHHPDRVSFGFLASANAFNIAGLKALVQELAVRVATTFAPVELVVAGHVGEHVESLLHIRKLGFVESEASFYAQVDYAIAPVFNGTGFKIKTADILALDLPSLFSEHSAEGTTLPPDIRFDSPGAMADRMVELALKRPALSVTRADVARARARLRVATERGGQSFVDRISSRSESLVIDLSSANPQADTLILQSFLSQARSVGDRNSVTFLLSSDLMRALHGLLPPTVRAMTAEQFRDRLAQGNEPRVTVLKVLSSCATWSPHLRPADRVFQDARWQRGCDAPGGTVFSDLPIFHSNLMWEPTAVALRKRRLGAAVQPILDAPHLRRLLFVDGPMADLMGSRVSLTRPDGTVYLRSDVWAILQEAVLALHRRQPGRIVWASPPRGVGFRAIVETCALLKIEFEGPMDEALVHNGALPSNMVLENDKRVAKCVRSLMQRSTPLSNISAVAGTR